MRAMSILLLNYSFFAKNLQILVKLILGIYKNLQKRNFGMQFVSFIYALSNYDTFAIVVIIIYFFIFF